MSEPVKTNAADQTVEAKPAQSHTAEGQPEIPKPAPKPAVRVGGLSPAAQKLQNLRDKAAQKNSGAKPAAGASAASFKAKSLAGTRKTSFQRKAV